MQYKVCACVCYLQAMNKDNKKVCKGFDSLQTLLHIFPFGIFYIRKLSSVPAATAEPITPATLGAMACISK